MMVIKNYMNKIGVYVIFITIFSSNCTHQPVKVWPKISLSELQGGFLTRDGIYFDGEMYVIPKKSRDGQLNLPYKWMFITDHLGIQGFYDSQKEGPPYQLTLFDYKQQQEIKSIWVEDLAHIYSIYEDKINLCDYSRVTQYSSNLDFEKVLFDSRDYNNEDLTIRKFIQIDAQNAIALMQDEEDQFHNVARLVKINFETKVVTIIENLVNLHNLFIQDTEVFYLKDDTVFSYSLVDGRISEVFTFSEGGIFTIKKDTANNWYVLFTKGETNIFHTLPTPYWGMITSTGEKYLIDGNLPIYDSNDPLYFEGIR